MGPVEHGQGKPLNSQKALGSILAVRVKANKKQPLQGFTQAIFDSIPLQSKNLENLHQGNKFFQEMATSSGMPADRFFTNQRALYLDETAYRHHVCAVRVHGGRVVPKCSLWVDGTGTLVAVSYLESREIYCALFERLARAAPELAKLSKMLDDGYNIALVGYDAPPKHGPLNAATFETAYNNLRAPFGHEWVIAALLVLKPAEYPWRRAQKFMPLEHYKV
jgi:hypothetical protein